GVVPQCGTAKDAGRAAGRPDNEPHDRSGVTVTVDLTPPMEALPRTPAERQGRGPIISPGSPSSRAAAMTTRSIPPPRRWPGPNCGRRSRACSAIGDGRQSRGEGANEWPDAMLTGAPNIPIWAIRNVRSKGPVLSNEDGEVRPWWEAREGEQPVAGLLEAVGDGAAFQAPFAEEGLAPGFDLLSRRGVDHVAVVVGDFLVQPLGRVSEQVAMLVHRAALDRRVRPQRRQRLFQARRAV